jgi:predicted amidohydrolase YtcJ
MTQAADTVFVDGEVHTLTDPDETHEAVAVRDGRIVRLGDSYDVEFLVGTETEVVDLDGRTLLPGFIDAHTHLTMVGSYLVHADLSGAADADEAISRLHDRADETASDADADDWVLGYGYDESTWPGGDYLDREDLDAVSDSRPVVAFREDMHVASVNSVVLDRLVDEMPPEDVHFGGDDPTGVVVEDAVGVVTDQIAPTTEETRQLVEAAQQFANERGVTGIHDMVRGSRAPEVYRTLELEDDLSIRVRINYWSDHIDALVETGLVTNHGSEMVQTGAIKSFTDGSFGGRTAKLWDAYEDAPEEDGSWVVDPEELNAVVQKADAAGFQVTVHAIGDEAIDETLDAFAACENPGEKRHRVEHVELASDEAIERFGDLGVVASVQPNFLKWAREGGLYDSRIGDRRLETNRFANLLEAGAPLAFSSDCMPLDPLLGIHQCVTADTDEQRLSVTDALRAYTSGAAYAGFDEDRLGTLERGKCADFTVLDESPWEADDIEAIDVAMTVVDGDVVYDDR